MNKVYFFDCHGVVLKPFYWYPFSAPSQHQHRSLAPVLPPPQPIPMSASPSAELLPGAMLSILRVRPVLFWLLLLST